MSVVRAGNPLPTRVPGTPVIWPDESTNPRTATVWSPMVRVWVKKSASTAP